MPSETAEPPLKSAQENKDQENKDQENKDTKAEPQEEDIIDDISIYEDALS